MLVFRRGQRKMVEYFNFILKTISHEPDLHPLIKALLLKSTMTWSSYFKTTRLHFEQLENILLCMSGLSEPGITGLLQLTLLIETQVSLFTVQVQDLKSSGNAWAKRGNISLFIHSVQNFLSMKTLHGSTSTTLVLNWSHICYNLDLQRIRIRIPQNREVEWKSKSEWNRDHGCLGSDRQTPGEENDGPTFI